MIKFRIEELVPRFLLKDKNGYALSKAIERALQIMCDKVKEGLDIILDVEKMPEWRLDEMAWELGVLYDYTAEVKEKRRWIREALPMFAAYGTPQAIYDYLLGVFDTVKVEENWEYGGEPFRFRVIVGGDYTQEKEAWSLKAIEQTKNVRSVLDALISVQGADSGIVIKSGNIGASILYPLCGAAECGGEMYLM
jgi:P2-related tail formation protein